MIMFCNSITQKMQLAKNELHFFYNFNTAVRFLDKSLQGLLLKQAVAFQDIAQNIRKIQQFHILREVKLLLL